jgi:hypothetical protein
VRVNFVAAHRGFRKQGSGFRLQAPLAARGGQLDLGMRTIFVASFVLSFVDEAQQRLLSTLFTTGEDARVHFVLDAPGGASGFGG